MKHKRKSRRNKNKGGVTFASRQMMRLKKVFKYKLDKLIDIVS